ISVPRRPAGLGARPSGLLPLLPSSRDVPGRARRLAGEPSASRVGRRRRRGWRHPAAVACPGARGSDSGGLLSLLRRARRVAARPAPIPDDRGLVLPAGEVLSAALPAVELHDARGGLPGNEGGGRGFPGVLPRRTHGLLRGGGAPDRMAGRDRLVF